MEFDLDDNEDQLTLDAPLVDDVAKATTPTAAPAPPVRPMPPSTANGHLGFTDERMQKYLDAYEKAMGGAATETEKTPYLASKAPAWYQTKAPPPSNQWAKDLIGMGAGMISGPAAVSMQNPLRPLGMKQQDAKQVALGQGLGALLGNLAGSAANRYAAETDTAAKQAGMTQYLSPSKSSSAKTADNLKNLLDLGVRVRGLESLEGNRQFQQEQTRNLHDVDSPEAQAQKDLLVKQGIITQDQADNQTLFTLRQSLPAVNAALAAESANARANAQAENQRANVLARQKAQSELEIQKKQHEDQQRTAQAFIDKDVVWKGGTPPDESTQRKVREQVAIRNYGLNAINDMKKIQNELNQMSHGFAGTFDQWLGRFEGTPEGVRAQQLIEQARQIRNNLKIQERLRANMGVPQKWEDQLVGSLIPQAGSIQGWLKGGAAWDALQNELDKYTYASIQAQGAGLKSKGDEAGAAPQYQGQDIAVPGIPKVQGRQTVQAPSPGPDLTLPPDVEAAVRAREVAPMAAPKAPGTVTITLDGESRQVPKDQALRLKQRNPKIEIIE